MKESEETEEITTFPLYPCLLQGQQALPNCKLIPVGCPSDKSYRTPSTHPTTPHHITYDWSVYTQCLPLIQHFFLTNQEGVKGVVQIWGQIWKGAPILIHCIRNRLSHTIYWKSPISILGKPSYEIYIFLEKNGLTICKQQKPWSDAAFCSIWSVSALFVKCPFTGLPTTMG